MVKQLPAVSGDLNYGDGYKKVSVPILRDLQI